jgi:hypothetical protein
MITRKAGGQSVHHAILDDPNRLYRYAAFTPDTCSGDECRHSPKHLSISESNVSDDGDITNQHHNAPPGWREEPVGDADNGRIDESGRKPRYLYRGGSHKYICGV